MKKLFTTLLFAISSLLLASASFGQTPTLDLMQGVTSSTVDTRVTTLLALKDVTNKAAPHTILVDRTLDIDHTNAKGEIDRIGHRLFLKFFKARIVMFTGCVIATSKGLKTPVPFVDVKDSKGGLGIARCYLDAEQTGAANLTVGTQVTVMGVCNGTNHNELFIDHCYVDQYLTLPEPESAPETVTIPGHGSVALPEMIRQLPERVRQLKPGMNREQVFKKLGLPPDGIGFQTPASGPMDDYREGYLIGPYLLGVVWDDLNLKSAHLEGKNVDLKIPTPATTVLAGSIDCFPHYRD